MHFGFDRRAFTGARFRKRTAVKTFNPGASEDCLIFLLFSGCICLYLSRGTQQLPTPLMLIAGFVLCCVLLCEGVSAELVSNKTMKQAAKRVICGGGLEMQARKRS